MQEEKNEVVIFRVPLCKQGEPEMKKKTVSKDPLAEKIEEILAPYPNPMSRNDFRIVCHIGNAHFALSPAKRVCPSRFRGQ